MSGKRNMKIKVFVIIFIGSLTLNVCQTTDDWLNKPEDNEFYYSESRNIPIIFIKDDRKNEAIILLNNVFYKKLTDDEYFYFSGKTRSNIQNAYLIRSVNYSFNETGYRIYTSEKNNMLISHSVLSGRKRKGYQKWPIIILFDDLENINEIYTTYSAAK